jgi:hypothetical protein
MSMGYPKARNAGPEGSPERAAALKDLVAKYGGDPDLIDHLLEIRGADASESAWAIKENIVAQNARKAGHDAVVALTDNLSPSEYQAALEKAVQAHPDWKAQKAIYDDLDARLSQAPGQSQERANLWDQRDAAQRKLDNIHDRLIDTVRVEAPAKIQEVMDVREAANPTPGAPNPKVEEAQAALAEISQRENAAISEAISKADPSTGPEDWHRMAEEARAPIRAERARLWQAVLDDALAGREPLTTEPGYALRPEFAPPEGVPASTIAPNPARAQAEEAYSRLQDQVQAVRESLGSTPTPRQLNTLMDLEDALKEARHRWLDVQTEPHFVTTPRDANRGRGDALAATTGLAPAAGDSAPANLARYANSALNTGGLGALVGSQADTEDATEITLPTGGTMRFSPSGARIGAVAGMGLGLAGARLARGEGGALATFGFTPEGGGPASALSDTASQAFNIFTNTLSQGKDIALTPIAATLDVGRVGALRAVGKPAEREVFFSEVPARLAGMRAGAKAGLEQAGEIMRTGLRPEDAAKLDEGSRGFGTNIPGLAPVRI